ncbi:uncharacterized protein N7469_000405 [Penicillium citrinum]|uniref:Uncharacterized protein n=1 Tax=Penicillium citrinum TaxID=5077 RepID=A0A9W9TUV4_PENCI|nr:uncharacterized protein N7469_000405 [Penicillium citrinum]KAJ5242078.1 hypothetical protein N7469_000405 [Penicillium citrinum]
MDLESDITHASKPPSVLWVLICVLCVWQGNRHGRFAKAHHDLGQATISFHATSTPGENLITYIRTLLVDFSLFTRLSLKRLATGGRLRKNTKVGASTAAISAPARWELQREFVISAMTRFPKSAKIGSEMRSLLGERPIDYEPLDPEPPRYGRHKHFEINDNELNYNNVRFEKILNFYEELDELEGYNYLQDLRAQAVTFIVAHREAEWPSRKKKGRLRNLQILTVRIGLGNERLMSEFLKGTSILSGPDHERGCS